MSQADLPSDKVPSPRAGVRAAEATRALRIVPNGPKALSRNQRRFNTLLARIETLRKEAEATTRRLDAALADYVRRIAPLRAEEHARRCAVVRALAEFWRAPKGLGKRQRTSLRDLLIAQFDALQNHPPGPDDEDLRVLLDDLMTDLEREEAEETKKHGGAREGEGDEDFELSEDEHVGDEDDDIDLSRFRPDMSMDEIMREFVRQKSQSGAGKGAAAGAGSGAKPRKPSAAQLKRERREAELAEARKRGISTIYKQLAKALHPDLERDPQRQAEKLAVMQQVTTAYQAGDLHTLLRLELEFIHREENRAAELGEEKLAIYCDLLGEQVRELESGLYDLAAEPRYAVLRPYLSGPGGTVADWSGAEARLRRMIEGMDLGLANFAQGGALAKQELRGTLAEFDRQEKLRARSPTFFFNAF
jgi:hypothetical protein